MLLPFNHPVLHRKLDDFAQTEEKEHHSYFRYYTVHCVSLIPLTRSFDECDTSLETLGEAFGDRDDSTGGGDGKGTGGGGKGGGGDGGGGVDRSRFHVHFGAGRLGLGLVVGAIAQSRTPFGVVQRPKNSWSGITSHVSQPCFFRFIFGGVLFEWLLPSMPLYILPFRLFFHYDGIGIGSSILPQALLFVFGVQQLQAAMTLACKVQYAVSSKAGCW